MNEAKFHLEAQAYRELQKLLEQGAATAELFEQAGLVVPAPLARMLGLPQANGNASTERPRLALSPLEPPWKPDHIEPDWIWLPVPDLYVTSVVLGILRTAKQPVPPGDIVT